MAYPRFNVFSEGALASLLGVKPPPLASGKNPLRQLEYIDRYVSKLECSTIIVETEYIDRDYIEDHSLFYSRNRESLPNYCSRVHFFRRLSVRELRKDFRRISALCKDNDSYSGRCSKFSDEFYLGFMVVKPLHGCPVGRTVLRTFASDCGEGNERNFRGSLPYKVHVLGVQLEVVGLAFQQQDQGVSACATTAIWTSLQKLKSTEELSGATPAQITMLASRFSLPIGRQLPSEGLNLEQMCQAIHALSISPDLLPTPGFEFARGITYAAALSDTTPILIIAHHELGRHAVTVAGIKRRTQHRLTPLGKYFDDKSGDLKTLYLHDDRIGPYVKAELTRTTPSLRREWKESLQVEVGEDEPQLTIEVDGQREEWRLTHVLTPIHNKVRLSFSQIRRIADDIGRLLRVALMYKDLPLKRVTFGIRVLRAHTYVKKLLADTKTNSRRRNRFFATISLSRYVGLIRLEAGKVGPFDALIDTTGTPRNARCLGIVYRGVPDPLNREIGAALAGRFACRFVD